LRSTGSIEQQDLLACVMWRVDALNVRSGVRSCGMSRPDVNAAKVILARLWLLPAEMV